jgi:phospholipid/cholesterol/gamma-HCH transport system permease protein
VPKKQKGGDMEHSGTAPKLVIDFDANRARVILSGPLRIGLLEELESALHLNKKRLSSKAIIWDLGAITSLDTAAAMLIIGFSKEMEAEGCTTSIEEVSREFSGMLAMVESRAHFDTRFETPQISMLEEAGKRSLERLLLLNNFLAFFGQLSATFRLYLRSLTYIRWREIAFETNESAIKALPIIALTTFLIGVVVAYQSAVQLKIYGANIFIVDMLGISIMRELAPMLTAIVVAGRSGSAYAAQIGVMKITEELDAMRTMGFDPYAFLVLPRVIALIVMMPILIFFSDIMGIIGGMAIANTELGLTPQLFMARFVEVIDIKHFWVGIVKGPFFAVLIATIGIFRGMMVQNDTQSIGFNTTKSVVESIFAVIICDALFSIIFTELGY